MCNDAAQGVGRFSGGRFGRSADSEVSQRLNCIGARKNQGKEEKMRAAKIDANQLEIVKALRKIGATVQSLAATGDGVPDLLVGYQGNTYLIEVKDGSKVPSARKLTPDQEVWHEKWTGGTLGVANSIEEALNIIEA